MKTLIVLILVATIAPAQTTHVRDVVSAAAKLLRERYVDPAIGDTLSAELEKKLRGGEYNGISGAELAETLTSDLQKIHPDKHLRITYSATPAVPRGSQSEPSSEGRRARITQLGGEINYGFRDAEILRGNIGYLAIDGFWHLEFGGGDTAAAAMHFLANTDALIIDLRESVHGGDPEMALLIASYFFPEQVHLSDFYSRPTNEMRQWWTLAWVPGQRYLNKPLFLLTSAKTLSAGEGFAYDLQSQKRATIVGEKTAGAAHPEEEYALTPNFTIELPFARSINAVTKTDWEGIGAIPDIPTSASSALDVAHLRALEAVLHNSASSRLTEERNAALTGLRKRLSTK